MDGVNLGLRLGPAMKGGKIRKSYMEKVDFDIPEDAGENLRKNLFILKNPSTPQDQVSAVQEVTSNVNSTEEVELLTKILIETLLQLQPKAQLRNKVLKCLSSLIKDHTQIVTEVLQQTLLWQLQHSEICSRLPGILMMFTEDRDELFGLNMKGEAEENRKTQEASLKGLICNLDLPICQACLHVFRSQHQQLRESCSSVEISSSIQALQTITKKTNLYILCRKTFKDQMLTINAEYVSTGDNAMEILLEEAKDIIWGGKCPLDLQVNCAQLAMITYLALGKGTLAQYVESILTNDDNIHSQLCQLSLLNGVLCYGSAKELCKEVINGTTVAVCILETALTYATHNEDARLALSCSRVVHQWVLKMMHFFQSSQTEEDVKALLHPESTQIQKLLQHLWIAWDHYLDNVKHLAKESFQNYIKIQQAVTADYKTYFEQMGIMFLHQLSGKSFIYKVLSCLVKVLGTGWIFKHSTKLVPELLERLSDPALASCSAELLETLFTQNCKEIDSKKWQEFWLPTFLACYTEEMQTYGYELLFCKLLSCCPDAAPAAVNLLVDGKSLTDQGMCLLFMTVKICRKIWAKSGKTQNFAAFEKNSVKLWKDMFPYNILEQGLFHKEESISDAAFALICESPKSTELFEKEELQLVLAYLKVSMCSQSPAYRQHLLKNIKKLMQRIDCGLTTLKKSLKTIKNRSIEPQETLVYHFEFCETLCHALFSNLHSGANFPRRGTSLQILEMLFTIVLSNHDDIIMAEKTPQSWTDSLVWILNDSYENNKVIALQLLKILPQKDLEIISPPMAKALLEAVCQLASSCRPPDSATASFLLQLLLLSSSSQDILREKMGVGPNKLGKELRGCYYALHNLQKEVKSASSHLIQAAASGPMYGWLTSLRSLLTLYVKVKSQEDVDGWRSLINEVIHTSFELTDIVAPVVRNSSPEGHLPMDLNPESLSALQLLVQSCLAQQATANNTSIEFSKEVSSDELVKAQAVSAQMLLLCAWRSVKEVSLMLGDMVLSAPIGNSSSSLLSIDQVTTIGKYFLTQLSETKHRGAFEQTYVGFGKVCERLWRCEDSQLRELPEVWLEEVLEAIQDPQNSQLCSTRRSAGIPFIIQAVLSTEPHVRGSISLNKTMTLLLLLASHPNYDNSEARVHAFNILRALYRDTILGDRIVPHVASGVKAALRGYTSKSWGERNAATLLFTALITRMLGVKKTQDDLHYRNAMSALVFFKRYPELYDFLLQQLQSCVDVVESSLTPSIYPVLLLLARLAPPPLEGRTGGLCLTPFMPAVLHCSKSPIWQLRVLSSKALCPLVNQKQLPQVFKQLCSELTLKCQNSLHGILLCLIELLRTNILCIKKSVDLQQDVISSLIDIIWTATASNVCLVTRGCAIEIFHFLLDNKVLQWTDSAIAPIVVAARELLESPSERVMHIPGSTQCLLTSSRFIFSCELSKGILTSSGIFPLLLESQYYEVREMTLEHLLKAPNLPQSVYIKLLMKIEEETHAGCLATMCMVIIRQLELCDYEGPDQVYRLLPVVLDRLQQETKLDNIEAFLLLSGAIVAALLKRDGWCNSQLELWCKVVVSMTSSEQSDNIRLAAANVILYIAPYLVESRSSPESLSLCLLEGLAVLLQDDDPLIRSKTARAAAIVCAEEKYNTQEAARLITPLCIAIANQRKDSPAVLTLFVNLTLREEVPEGFGLAQDDDRVFDKGEMNMYGEELIMAEGACTGLAHALQLYSSPQFLLYNIKPNLLMAHTKRNSEICHTNQVVPQEDQKEIHKKKNVLIQKCTEELAESDKLSLEEMVDILIKEIEMICFQVEDLKTKLPLQVRHLDIWLVRLACRAKLLAVLKPHIAKPKSISREAMDILEGNLIKNVLYIQVLQDIKG